MNLWNKKYFKEKIMITGSSGMVGQSLQKILINHNVITADFPYVDLRNDEETDCFFNKYRPSYVIHLAAKVGGVKGNKTFIGDFFTDNIKINTNVLYCSHKYKIKKVLSLLSTCVYPDKVYYPLTEEQIHNGPPHDSNYSYAYTKRMMDIQSKAYREQFGNNFITIIPNNLMGINDNFDLENSHVIPALIRKIYEANKNQTDVEIWGNGEQLREFTYVDDLADIIMFMLQEYNEKEPINIGNTKEYSIKYIVEILCNYLNFKKNIFYNLNKPTGQFRKPSSNEKFKNFALKHNKKIEYTELKDGLTIICDWFVNNYPNIRGVK